MHASIAIPMEASKSTRSPSQHTNPQIRALAIQRMLSDRSDEIGALILGAYIHALEIENGQ